MATLIAGFLFALLLVYLCRSFLGRRKTRHMYTQLALALSVLTASLLV